LRLIGAILRLPLLLTCGVCACTLLSCVACGTASSGQSGKGNTVEREGAGETVQHATTRTSLEDGKTTSMTETTASELTTAHTTPDAPTEDAQLDELEAALEDLATRSGVREGIAVKDLGGTFGGEGVGVGEDLVFESASLIKVLILAELLRQVDKGQISLDDPLGDSTVGRLAKSMIVVSDNAAANLLMDRVGFEEINTLARDLGLKDTHLSRHMLDYEVRGSGKDNLTSASDMVTLFSAIWKGEFLSSDSRKLALSILRRQRLNEKIPAALPLGTFIAHKTGELPSIEHDAGVVILPDGAFAIAVLTEGDNASGIATIRRAAGLTYETFSTPEASGSP
jgi:beta-lactamase class A